MENRSYPQAIESIATPEPFVRQSFNDAREAVATLRTLYARNTRFLRDSFALGHKAIASITPDNALQPVQTRLPFKTRFALAAWASTHAYDIYGQMVEYLRMNGIVPPASRQRTE